MEELNEIKKWFDKAMAKAEEIVKKNGGKSEDKRWRAEVGKAFWHVNSFFDAVWNGESHSNQDRRQWEAGNYFQTEEEAQKVAQHFKDYLILRADAKGFETKDPDDECFYVYWCHYFASLRAIADYQNRSGVIYFKNEEDANASIEKHGDIWKRYLGVEK